MSPGVERTAERMDARTFYELQADLGASELVDGEVRPVTPTGRRHGRLQIRLGRLLDEYVEARGRGEVVGGDVGYQLAHDQVRGADIAVHLEPPPEKPGWETVMPDLVVEIVSPSDRWVSVERKAADYLGAGVAEVWIIDPARRLLSMRCPDGAQHTFAESDDLTSEALEGFVLPLSRLFG